MSSFEEAIRTRARELGFDAVGFARADTPLDEDYRRYESFLEAGMHGQMGWLAQYREVRQTLDGPGMLEGAKSVICLACRYARDEHAEEREPSLTRHLARYARGRDYHKGMRRRLQRLATFVRSLAPDVRARPLVDDAPVLERAWAARAGLGFVGKNGLLIIPGQGSYALLGEVLTTLELLPDAPLRERCGSCTRCLDACPTGAFAKPFVLDARRCVAYLTIELRGAIPEELRDGVGEHLFGCDVCQEVCPFNRTKILPSEQTEMFAPLPRWKEQTLADLLALDAESWPLLSQGTPVRRATETGLVRNAITVAANMGRRDLLPMLKQLQGSHHDETVREHAAWAVEKIECTT